MHMITRLGRPAALNALLHVLILAKHGGIGARLCRKDCCSTPSSQAKAGSEGMQHTLRSLPGLPLYVLPLSPLSLYSVTLSLLHMLKNTTLSPHLTPSYQGYDMIGPHLGPGPMQN